MTEEEANDLILKIGGSDNKEYWHLHIEVARDCGRYAINYGDSLMVYCVENALPKYMQLYNDPRLIPNYGMNGSDEYEEIIAAQDLLS